MLPFPAAAGAPAAGGSGLALAAAGFLCCPSNPNAELPLVPALPALCGALLQSFQRSQEDLAVADEAEHQLDATPDTLSLQDQLQQKQQQAVQATGAGEEEVQVRAEACWGQSLLGRTAAVHLVCEGLACPLACPKLSHLPCCRRRWWR